MRGRSERGMVVVDAWSFSELARVGLRARSFASVLVALAILSAPYAFADGAVRGRAETATSGCLPHKRPVPFGTHAAKKHDAEHGCPRPPKTGAAPKFTG